MRIFGRFRLVARRGKYWLLYGGLFRRLGRDDHFPWLGRRRGGRRSGQAAFRRGRRSGLWAGDRKVHHINIVSLCLLEMGGEMEVKEEKIYGYVGEGRSAEHCPQSIFVR